MAIKIDLLPGYVKLKRDLHRTIAGCVVTTGILGGALLMMYHQKQLDLETATANLAAANVVVAQVDAATAEQTAAVAAAGPAINAVSFMAAASKTGPQRAALLHLVRQNIYQDAIISSIDISDGLKVIIQATVRTPDEYARFLRSLRQGSDVNGGTLFKGLPVASGVGGFANGAVPFLRPSGDGTGEPVPIIYPVSVRAEGTLLNPVQIPPDPVGAPAATVPGFEAGAPPV